TPSLHAALPTWLRRLARGRSGRFGRISARASTVLARVVVGFAAAASVASRQSDVVDVSSCRARRQSYTALRHNGAVKLSGLLGSLVEAGRGSYSTVDGPEHGRARSFPHGRYAVFGSVKSSEAPVDHANGTDVGHPARDCAVCQDASSTR